MFLQEAGLTRRRCNGAKQLDALVPAEGSSNWSEAAGELQKLVEAAGGYYLYEDVNLADLLEPEFLNSFVRNGSSVLPHPLASVLTYFVPQAVSLRSAWTTMKEQTSLRSMGEVCFILSFSSPQSADQLPRRSSQPECAKGDLRAPRSTRQSFRVRLTPSALQFVSPSLVPLFHTDLSASSHRDLPHRPCLQGWKARVRACQASAPRVAYSDGSV
jgi:hypothetical protein